PCPTRRSSDLGSATSARTASVQGLSETIVGRVSAKGANGGLEHPHIVIPAQTVIQRPRNLGCAPTRLARRKISNLTRTASSMNELAVHGGRDASHAAPLASGAPRPAPNDRHGQVSWLPDRCRRSAFPV